MFTVDAAGWLKTDSEGDPEIRIVPSKRNGKLRAPPCELDSPVAAWPIAHISHTTDLTVSMEKLARRIVLDNDSNTGASWHVGFARDGVIWQSNPFTVSTRHVGNPGTIEGHAVANVNRCTIGTEMESPGRLRSIDGAYYLWPYWRVAEGGRADRGLGLDPANRLPELDPYGQPFEVVSDGEGGWWPEFTDAQIAAYEALVRAVSAWRPEGLPADAEPPLGRASAWRYGHVDFPGKSGKEDPGKLWPAIREAVLARVFGATS